MIDLLNVILQSFWTWVGTFLFLVVICDCIVTCVKLICYTSYRKDRMKKEEETTENYTIEYSDEEKE